MVCWGVGELGGWESFLVPRLQWHVAAQSGHLGNRVEAAGRRMPERWRLWHIILLRTFPYRRLVADLASSHALVGRFNSLRKELGL